MTRTHTILVAEEHPATRNFLIDNLAADGYRTLAAEDRAEGARAAGRRAPRPGRGRRQRRDPCPARRGQVGLRAREPDRPRHAADRRSPASPMPFTGSACSSGAATTSSRSRSPTRSCAPGSRHCFAGHEQRPGIPHSPYRTADDRRSRPRGPRRRRTGRAVGEGIRAPARAVERPDAGVHARGAAARCLGLPQSRPRRAPWTATPTGCGPSSRVWARRSWWSTCGGWATGYAMRRCSANPAAPARVRGR